MRRWKYINKRQNTELKEIQRNIRILDIAWTNYIDGPCDITDKHALQKLHENEDTKILENSYFQHGD